MTSFSMDRLLIYVACYLLGSVPFGLLVTKLAGLGDIRQIGSGNIGATNVLRTGKKGLAILTVLLDGGKGALAVCIAEHYCQPLHTNVIFDQSLIDCIYLAAFAVFIGHLFPVWLKFRGGKGVATTIGTALMLFWPIGIGIIAIWLLVALSTRYSSLAALISIGLAPVAALCMGSLHGACLGFVIFGFIVYKHKDNIRRLIAGTELRIGKNR